MKYRPRDAEFLTNGEPDEDKILRQLEGITNRIDSFVDQLDILTENLSNIQHDIIIAVSSSRDSNRTRDFNKSLSAVMDNKRRIKELYDANIYPLMFFIQEANHLRTLKKYINEDEYLKQKWNEVMLYMRMKDTSNEL